MMYEHKDNGFMKGKKFTENIERFDEFAKDIFGDELAEIEHFQMGHNFSFSDIRLTNGDYMHYRINERYIAGSDGHSCTPENYKRLMLIVNHEM